MAASLPERERELLRRIDGCVDRMRAVTPDEPYVLSIPQDEPKFHHHSHHSSQMWRSGTPFRSDDDPNQQYQTFYYHEPLSDVFQLHRNSHYQKDNVSVSSQQREKESSSQSTPSMLPKKKISLAAYANKKTHPDSNQDAKYNKPHHNKTLSESTSSQSLGSHDSANLPRMLSPLHIPQRDHSQQSQPRPLPPPPPPPPPPSQQQQQQQQRPQQPLFPPRLISPTLPPSIIASLDANPYQPSRHKHATKRLPSPLPPLAESSRKHPPNIPEPKTRDSPQEKGEQHSAPLSRIVKFKVPKSMRRDLCRMLKMKPQPQTHVIRVLLPDKSSAPAEAQSQAAKRSRQTEEDAPLPEPKRKKAVKPESNRQEPSIRQEPGTPSPAAPAAQKATPTVRNTTKDLRTSAAMKRVESTDSMVNGTPQSSRQVNGVTKPSPSSGNTKTAESSAWDVEAARVGKLGRELKHAASALDDSRSNGGNNESRSRETAAVMSLESFLLFMLSFYCSDRGLASRNPPVPLEGGRTWGTIPAFLNFVRTRCQHFEALDGIACHLGAVCNAMIMLRLTTIRERSQDMTPEEARTLHSAASASLKASREGNAKLPLSIIMSTFPKTWKKAMSSNGPALRAEDDVKIGRYGGDITLPFGLNTEPLVAVRVGYALLREWCAIKGLKHEMKLGL